MKLGGNNRYRNTPYTQHRRMLTFCPKIQTPDQVPDEVTQTDDTGPVMQAGIGGTLKHINNIDHSMSILH